MQATIDRFEGEMAILRFSGEHAHPTFASQNLGRQELIVPRSELPKDAHEGSVLFVLISDSPTEEEAREKLAKSILNEILNNEV